MLDTNKQVALTQRVYEFIKMRGCATSKEVAETMNISATKAYTIIRALYAKRLVLPYRPQVGRERVFCIPDVGDKLYGRASRINSAGAICITLPVDMIEILDEIATRTGKTRSSLIRETLAQLIDTYLGEDDRYKQPRETPEDEKPDFIVPIR